MQRPFSLALRLTLSFGIAAAIVFSGFGWITERSIKEHFRAEDVAEIEIISQAVHQALATSRSKDELAPIERRFDDILVGHHHASLYIADRDGQPLFASPGPDLSKAARLGSDGGDTVRQWADADHSYRVLVQSMGADSAANAPPYTVVVAVPIDYHLRFLEHFHQTLWMMVASGFTLMSFMGWLAVRQGHAPLRDIVAKIRSISASQLHTRLSPEAMPAELIDLAASCNDMLGRVEDAFQRLSNYAADIAHELRTPVTSLMTQTQVALSQARTPDEYREILYSNIEEYERMAQMIGDMLFLAKADNGLSKPSIAAVDLAGEVRALFDYYEAWAEERGVSLALEGDATISGDRLMLRRALSNLLSNAIRHTPPGQTVQVRLDPAKDDEISIVVENPGATIPAEHIPRLFDRFYRVDSSRQRGGDGAGLGLAIVKSIVAAHGGRIEVTSIEDKTRFRITLPKPPRAG